MTGKTAEKLRSLLKTYDERSAARPPAEVRTAPDEAERRRRACGDRLLNAVRPVVQAFLTEPKSAGHEGAIEDRTNTADAYPSGGLRLTPRAPGGAAPAADIGFLYGPAPRAEPNGSLSRSSAARSVTAAPASRGASNCEPPATRSRRRSIYCPAPWTMGCCSTKTAGCSRPR